MTFVPQARPPPPPSPSLDELKQIVCDNFADHNTRGIGVWAVEDKRMLTLNVFVGLKKYTSDPSSMSLSLPLFGHHFRFVGDVKDGTRKINKFDWDCLITLLK